ncbi:MAG: YkgJ family cysteine cluster protein [Bacteroidetes bacterium]|nr:YkgJ family cysteine cluster protein [Bacteroidota bacterium]
MIPKLEDLPKLAKNAKTNTEKFFNKLRKNQPKLLDSTVEAIHEEVFATTDCLKCANCCKTTSPIFYQKDIERLSKLFRVRPAKFIQEYLHMDEDNDYVLNSAPCAFLGEDNYCTVYDHRPNACREYPHTDRKRFYQVLDITLRNTAVCPAAYAIVEKLKKVM